MDSNSDVLEHESSAKRLKLDHSDSNCSELSKEGNISGFSTLIGSQIDVLEAALADCDSGYEASTLEPIPHTPYQQVSPQNLDTDTGESFSSLSQTPTCADQQDTSQDGIEAEDDNASTVSHLSELSGLSDLSGQDWKPTSGSMVWVQKQMQSGVNPRSILGELGVDADQLPTYLDDVTMWKLIATMLSEPPRRNKLRHINTLDDVVRLLRGAQKIIVLTGAGVSVSCGIPDFRSRDGIYSRLALDFPDLPDPQAMFDIYYFSQDPRPFFKFARDIYPGKFQPSPCHRFIKLLEKQKKLFRNYTQNIDTLEKVAGIERVIECHGSFATATCTKCYYKVTADAIRDVVLAQKIPLCEKCHPEGPLSVSCGDGSYDYRKLVHSGIMKPDIVFFGEGLPDTFHRAMNSDKEECDLLLVIGSSLKVRPVALIPSSLPAHVPQILINREPLPHCHFDVELLGDCDVIINHLCRLLGNSWEEGIYDNNVLSQVSQLLPLEEAVESTVEKESGESKETQPNYIENSEIEQCRCNTDSSDSSFGSMEKSVEYDDLPDNSNSASITHNYSDTDMKFKERHMSIDSARDSGIGENSNFTDSETNDQINSHSPLAPENEKQLSLENTSISDMRGYWQPKVKKSLADRLPPNSFYRILQHRYIFPGAEVFYDPDDSFLHQDNSSAEDSDSDSDIETTK